MNGDEIQVVDPFNGDGATLGSYASGNYAVNPTVSRQFSENYGNPKNNKYTLTATPGQAVRLTTVDGQVLYEGSGEEAVNKAADIVDAMNKAYGPGATWKLQTKPEGAQDFTTVSQDTVTKQKKTALNSFLDVALPLAGGILLPGIGGVLGSLGGVSAATGLSAGTLAAGLGAGGASLLNSTLQNQSLDDTIKSALLNAAGAGAGSYLGGKAGAYLGNLGSGGAQTAAQTAGQTAGQTALQGAGQTAGNVVDDILVQAGKGVLGSTVGGGLGSLAGSGLSGSTLVNGQPANPNMTTLDDLIVKMNPGATLGGTVGAGGGTVIGGQAGGQTGGTPQPSDPGSFNSDDVVVTAQTKPPVTPVPGLPSLTPTGPDSQTSSPVTVTATKPGTILQDLGAGAGTIIAGTGGTILWNPPTMPTTVDQLVVNPPKPGTQTGTTVGTTVGTIGGSTASTPGDSGDKKPTTSDVVTGVLGGLLGLGAGGSGSSGTNYTSPTYASGTAPGQPGSLSDAFRGTLPTTNLNMTQRDMSGTDWKRYGFGPEKSFFVNVPEQNFAKGGYAVQGPGTGRSDSIKANLSDGEYVVDAETVALLGDGSSKAGARKLDELRVKVRKAKGKDLSKGKFSVKAHAPEHYMRGGR